MSDGNVTFTYTLTTTGCSRTTNSVTVKQTPIFTSPITAGVCSGLPFNYTPTSDIPTATISWTRAAVIGISNTAGSGVNPGAINETLVNTTGGSIDVIYRYTVSLNGCSSTQDVTVTVSPPPTLNSSLTPPAVCSNTVFSYTPVPTIGGTTMTWTRAAVANISNPAVTVPVTGNISETLVNTSAANVTVRYVYSLTYNGCTNTQNVDVVVKPTPTVNFQANLEYCVGASVPTIVFTGTGTTYEWGNSNTDIGLGASGTGNIPTFTASNAGTSPITATISVYPKANGCDGAILSFTIVVYPNSQGGTVGPNNSVCAGDMSVRTLTLIGRTGSIVEWQSSTVSDFSSGVVTIPNTTNTHTYTNLGTTTYYRAVVKSGPCTVAYSNPATITVNQASVGGTIAPVVATVCSGTNSGTLTLSGHIGNITKWQSTTNNWASWTDIANTSTSQTYTNLTTTTKYRAVVQNGTCLSDNSSDATITVDLLSVGGSVSGGTTVCTGTNSTTLTLSGNVGNVSKWQSSTVSDFSSLVTDIVNTSTSLVATNLVTTTYYRAVVTSGVCSSANSTSATITVNQASVGGSVSGGATVCAGTNSTNLTLAGHFGSISKWQSSTVADFSSAVTDVANNTTGLTASNLSVTTYYRAVVINGVCAPANSLSATITVNAASAGGSISGGTNVCAGTNSTILALGGSVGAVTKWQSSTVSNFSSSVTDIVNTTTSLTATNLGVTTYYRAVVKSGNCLEVNSLIATVTVDQATVGGNVTGSAIVCAGTNSTTLTLTGYTGSVNKWQSSTVSDFSSAVTDIANTTTSLVATNLSATTYYRAVVQSGVCLVVNSLPATVTVNPGSVGGSITGGAPVCSGTNSTTLTLGSHTGNVIKWQSSTVSDFSSAVTDIVNTTTSLVVTDIATTTYYRAVVQNGICIAANSATATVAVSTNPILTLHDPTPVCAPLMVNLTLPAVTAGSTLPAGTILTYYANDGITLVPDPTLVNADTYYIQATTVDNCTDIQSVVVSVYTTLGAVTFNSALIPTACKGSAPVTYTASANNSLTLTYALDAASDVANNIDVNTGQVTFGAGYTGTMEITATATGCGGSTAQAIYTVIVSDPPVITSFTASSAAICVGGSITLSATSTGGTTIKTFNSGVISLNQAVPENKTSPGAGSITTLVSTGGETIATTDIIEVTLNINHVNNDHLDIFLVGPNGGCMLLSSDNGGNGDHYSNAGLRTGALPNISTTGNTTISGIYGIEGNVSTLAPQAGAYRNGGPPSSYSNTAVPQTTLLGSPINGNWQLRVYDDTNGTTGTLVSWSIKITRTTPNTLTTVFSGPGTTATVYSGISPLSATQTFTPPSGNHTYTVTTTENGCSTTRTVDVVVSSIPVPTITADYCTIRPKVRLTAPAGYANYVWSNGVSGPSANYIDVDIAGNYTVTVTSAGGCVGSDPIQVAEELVVNGNFEAGNTGFTTDYGYRADIGGNTELNPEGLYGVGTSGRNYHGNFWGFDNTTNVGTGNFMIVNGWGSTFIVWQQANKPVTPNTDYYFAANAISLNTVGPFAELRFEVNGVQVGTTANLTSGTGSDANPWKPEDRFYGMWNSGSATTATIRIINLEPSLGGNDFGLDDISFGSLASVVFDANPSTTTTNNTVCSGSTLALESNVTGAKPPVVYLWTGPAGSGFTSTDENPVIANVTAAYQGNYSLSVIDDYGCDPVTRIVNVTVNPTPVIPNQAPIIVCSGSAFTVTPVNGVPDASTIVPANIKYTWSAPTGTGFTGGSAQAVGQNSISQTLTNTTTSSVNATYTVTPSVTSGTPAIVCTGTPFTVTVTISPTVTANAGTAQTKCADAPNVTLAGSLGGAATSGTWSGGAGSYNPNNTTLNAVYTPSAAEITAGTVTLTLTSNDPDGAGGCAAATSTVTITILPLPVLSSTKTDVLCFGNATGAIDLTVSSAGATPSYVWTASAGGVVPVGQANIQDPTGLVAGIYTVVVTSTAPNTCTATTSVTITQPAAALTASAVVTGTLCNSNATGTITLTPAGGVSPYTYLWTASGGGVIPAGQSTNKDLTLLLAGSYSVTVRDVNNCPYILSNIVVSAAANTAPAISTSPVTRSLNGCTTAIVTGPVFSSTVANSSYAVFSDANNLGVATDNCAIATVTYSDVVTPGCPIVVTRTWTLTDGDATPLSTTRQQTINIVDNTTPTWTNGAGFYDRTVECSDFTGLTNAQSLLPAATDNCLGVVNVVKTPGVFVPSVGCTQAGTITNTFVATDVCGNYTGAYTQVITIVDTTPPTWNTPVGSLNALVDCDDPTALDEARAYEPEANDLCYTTGGFVLTKIEGSFVPGGCGNAGTYTNSWTTKDACGNTSLAFIQTITVVDTKKPTWGLTAPLALNRSLECGDAAGLTAAQALFPVATDNCDGTVTNIVKTTVSTVPGSCAQDVTYTYSWTVTDDCGNTSQAYTQVIQVKDNTAPVLTVPGNKSIAYGASTDPDVNLTLGKATATDNCSTAIISYTDVTTAGTCTGSSTITRTWKATDACGKFSEADQTINIQDVAPPVITGTIAPTDLEACNVSVVPAAVTTVAALGSLGLTITDNAALNPNVTYVDATSGTCPIVVTRTYMVKDVCNNESTVNQVFNVEDTTKPVITFCPTPPATLDITNLTDMTYEHSGTGWNATATDNCNVLTITAELSGNTSSLPNLTTLDGVAFNTGTTTVTWTAMDACGNENITCTFDVVVRGSTDLEIIKTGPAAATVGTQFEYAITVTNNGPVSAPVVTIQDVVDPLKFTNPQFSADGGGTWVNWTGSYVLPGALADGASASIRLRGTPACSAIGTLSNTATVAPSPISDSDPSNNTSGIINTAVTDATAPTLDVTLTPFTFCVSNIQSAVYNPNPNVLISPLYDDLTTERPEYYRLPSTAIFDLDEVTNNFDDNCCADEDLVIHWEIIFAPTPDPSTVLHLPITKAPITGKTGQPSLYTGVIDFPGDGVTFLDVIHQINYWLEDCHGNPKVPVDPVKKTVNIVIKPRPKITRNF